MKTILFFTLFCLNLSHAQTGAYPYPPGPGAPPVPTAPSPPGSSTAPPTPPTTAEATSAIINSVNSVLDKNKPTTAQPTPSPKYQEHLSICRTNDYDTIAFFSEATKEKRLEILKDRVSAEPDSPQPKLWVLKEFIDQGKFDDAEKYALELKKLKIPGRENEYVDAALALTKRNIKKARDILVKVTVDNPKDVSALKFLGELYKAEQNFYEASAVYYDLAKITKEKYDDQLCESLTLDAQYSEADAFCRRSAGAKNPFGRIYLGIAAREGQNLKEARRQFIESLKIRDTEMGHVCLGEIFFLEKNQTEATNSFGRAAKISPKSNRAMSALAWSYFDNKDRLKAFEYFEKNCRANKKTVVEVRRALQTLINEKSEHIQKYSDLALKCESLS